MTTPQPAPCASCGAAGRDKQGNPKHEPYCPNFLRGPDPGGDPHEWARLW